MFVRNVAIVVLYTKDHKIFLQKRTSISKCGEEWGFWGGRLEEGETPEQAAVREIKEELDFDMGKMDFLGKTESIVKRAETGEQITLRETVFLTEVEENLDQFTINEGDGGNFFTLEEAKNLKMVPITDDKNIKLLEDFFNSQ